VIITYYYRSLTNNKDEFKQRRSLNFSQRCIGIAPTVKPTCRFEGVINNNPWLYVKRLRKATQKQIVHGYMFNACNEYVVSPTRCRKSLLQMDANGSLYNVNHWNVVIPHVFRMFRGYIVKPTHTQCIYMFFILEMCDLIHVYNYIHMYVGTHT
jgi:hypothetical protein